MRKAFALLLVYLAIAAAPWSISLGQDIVINEVDADQAGSDSSEFVELYDGGEGNTPLDGLVIVFFNGNNDSSYLSFDLDGFSTDANGLFVIGNPGVPNVSLVFEPGSTGALQNGPDGVALFTGDASDFPNSTPVTSDNLIDALVYGTDDGDAFGLLDVLTPGQDQINDTGAESMARVPDGGTARQTSSYINQAPSPGLRNKADENLNLGISIAPDAIAESATTPAIATITRTGPTTSPATLLIEVNDPSEIFADATAEFGIGESTITVELLPVDDLWADGTQTVTIAVREKNNALNPAEASIDVEDDGDENAMVVNEVYPSVDNFSGDANKDGEIVNSLDEFVELVNASDTPYDLSGFTLQDAVTVRHTFPAGTIVDPGCAIVVFGGGNIKEGLLEEFGNALVQKANGANEFGLSLNNSGDIATIRNPDDLEVAGASWGEVNPADGSLTRDPDITGDFNSHAVIGFDSFGPGLDIHGDPFCEISLTLSLEVSPSTIAEDAGAAASTLTITRTGSTAQAIIVTLVNDDSSEISLPAEVTIPAGQSSVTVSIAAVNDEAQDGTQTVVISASAPGYVLDSTTIDVTDDGDEPVDVVINEFDSDQDGTDTMEFIELYDGGTGNLPLDGLIVVLFNGANDTSYATIDLNGQSTDASGFLVLGSAEVPAVTFPIDGFQLQNGADAIAVYRDDADNFPNGTFVSSDNLVDAVVYGTGDPDASGLLDTLTPDGIQIDEGDANNGNAVARVPDGGLPFDTTTFVTQPPTPGRLNEAVDNIVATANPSTLPESATTPVTLNLSRTGPTDREVVVDIAIDDPTELTGAATATFSVGQAAVTVQLFAVDDLWPDGDQTVTVTLSAVDSSLKSATITITVTDDGDAPVDIVINEIDPDQTGTDAGEFVELYDGGRGNVPLDGFIVVLFNGSSGTSYTAVDLAGQMTNANGFFVLGSPDLPQSDLAFAVATNAIQNAGDAVDAIAVYRDTIDNFPAGSGATETNLVDALVYGNADATDDNGLLEVLTPLGDRIDEDPNRATNAVARVPDGGAAFDTSVYRRQSPTPGTSNSEGGELGFGLWALQYPGIGGPTANGDSDPMSNALEYALGLNPTANDIGSLPAPAINANGKLEFTVEKGSIAGSDGRLSYIVEVSSNQIEWTTAGTTVDTNSASTLTVHYTGNAQEVYMRLRVTLTQ